MTLGTAVLMLACTVYIGLALILVDAIRNQSPTG